MIVTNSQWASNKIYLVQKQDGRTPGYSTNNAQPFLSPHGHMHTRVSTHNIGHVQAALHHVLLQENGNVQRCVEQSWRKSECHSCHMLPQSFKSCMLCLTSRVGCKIEV
ncbi:TPA: hypothetical protein ACH3X1_009812 [Trebouxia sp. C0004]